MINTGRFNFPNPGGSTNWPVGALEEKAVISGDPSREDQFKSISGPHLDKKLVEILA